MYKVNLYKKILDGEMVDIKTAALDNYLRNNPDFNPDLEFNHRSSVEFCIELPFPPHAGLTITGEFNGHYINSGKIVDVTWDNDNQCFSCFLRSEFPLKSWNYEYDHDYYLKQAIDHGWTCIDTVADD